LYSAFWAWLPEVIPLIKHIMAKQNTYHSLYLKFVVLAYCLKQKQGTAVNACTRSAHTL